MAMSFELDERSDLRRPTILKVPPDVHSLAAAEEAIEWADCYGLNLDADQRTTLTVALAERADGGWCAPEVADFKGRQAGKNDTIKARQGAGVDLFGEMLLIHTAQKFPTANEDFLRLVQLYEAYDDLRRTVKRIRYANGEQAIEFLSGARIKYMARTNESGRGFAEADVVFYDESQHLEAEQIAASMPAMLANPKFQAWYAGSGGVKRSHEAWNLRLRALRNDPADRLAYTECTAQTVKFDADGRLILSVPSDLMSEEALLAHPGYAHGRVPRVSFKTMYDALRPQRFAREILCCWEDPPEGVHLSTLIDGARWEAMTDVESMAEESSLRLSLAVNESLDMATFCVAGKRSDGLTHVAVRYLVPPSEMSRLVELAKRLATGHDVRLTVRGGSPVMAWVDQLTEDGVDVDVMKPQEYAAACGKMVALLKDGTLRHRGQVTLNAAIGNVADVGSVGDLKEFARKNPDVDISAFEAATVALGRVSVPQRKKRTKALARVGA